MEIPAPLPQHQWLTKLVGQWTTEAECGMGPGQPVEKFRGKETVRALGDLWILCEGEGEMPGGGVARNVFTFGFDPAKDKFVGTFIASAMNMLWIYEGALDPSGTVLTLDCEGPSWADPGKRAKYQDIITVVSDDHRILTSQLLGDDGKWTQFMTSHYWRVK